MNIRFVAWVALFLSVQSIAASNPSNNHPFARVDMVYKSNGCSFPYSPVNYCDEKHVREFKDVLASTLSNFNGHYIVVTPSEWPAYHQKSVVALDVLTGVAIPLPIDAYSGPIDANGKVAGEGGIEYRRDSDTMCIKGTILVYRELQEGEFCFTLKENKFIGHHTEYMEAVN